MDGNWKSEHHHWVLNNRISPDVKYQLELTVWVFGPNLFKNGIYCQNKRKWTSLLYSTLVCNVLQLKILCKLFKYFSTISLYHKWKRVFTIMWMYKLSHEFLSNLQLMILGNSKNSWKYVKWLEFMASTQPLTEETNFDSYAKRLQKISSETFHRKKYLINFLNYCTMFGPWLDGKTYFHF